MSNYPELIKQAESVLTKMAISPVPGEWKKNAVWLKDGSLVQELTHKCKIGENARFDVTINPGNKRITFSINGNGYSADMDNLDDCQEAFAKLIQRFEPYFQLFFGNKMEEDKTSYASGNPKSGCLHAEISNAMRLFDHE